MSFDCIIKNGKIWNGREFLTGLNDVGIVGDKITKIGKVIDESKFVFEVNGAIVSCGLIDLHTHIKGCGSEYFGIPAELSCFPFGVTTAVEAWTDKDGNKILDNMLLDTFVFLGVGIINNHADFSVAEKLAQVYGKRVLGYKLCFDKSNLEIIDETPLIETCEYAKDRGLKTLVHSTGSPVPMKRVFEILNKGDICTHIFHGGENSVSKDDYECLRLARKKGIILDNGMAGGVHTDFSIAKKAIEKGELPDTISTDITKVSAFIRGGNYGMTLCMSIMRELGMDETEILKAVTSMSAKVINQEDIKGSLEVGKKADVSVLDYRKNPFEIYDRAGNCVKSDYSYVNLLTIKNGQVVFRANI